MKPRRLTSAQERGLRRQMAFIVRPKKDMIPLPGSDVEGRPGCPLGTGYIWEKYDAASEMLISRGDPAAYRRCALAGHVPPAV